MSILRTVFPTVAVNVARGNAKAAIERMRIPLDTAIGNLNAIINKLEMRESCSVDEQINIGSARNLLMQIETQMTIVEGLLSQES